MLRSIVSHVYPPFIFLFWITVFLTLSNVVFKYRHASLHIATDMHGTRMVVNIIGALFSIFLGFVVYISWTNYKEATQLVGQEATKIYTVWENSKGFPEPVFHKISDQMQQYVSSLMNDEWSSMKKGRASPATQKAQSTVYAAFLNYRPSDMYSQNYYNRAMSSLDQASELRNQRLNMLNIIIPSAWYVIVLIGASTIIIVSVFMLENNILGYGIQTLLCLFLSFYLTSIVILSHPLSGIISISNQPYKELLHKITR
ncbi:bestrophin-like domain [Legionella spiritensis]|uniref:bestrophin-like domain n=1 Tax=Legionella spiritensis TaxID=452 RepID=UPI000F6B9E36|nr:bestrophin family ion channel [Legionella spiritensis]VEG92463.1 Uncharacterised protein [Legionella spiritensis]